MIDLNDAFLNVYRKDGKKLPTIAGKSIRNLRLSEIENRIKHPEAYVFICAEKEE